MSGRQIRGRTRRTQLSQGHGQALRGRGRAEPGWAVPAGRGRHSRGVEPFSASLPPGPPGLGSAPSLGPFHLWAFILRPFRWGQAPTAGGELLPRGWEGGGRRQPAPLPPGLTVVGTASLLCRGVQLRHVGASPAGAPPGETPHCTPAFAVVLISQARVWNRFQLWSSVPGAGNSELRPCPKDSQAVGRWAYLINRNRLTSDRVCPRG